MIKLEGGGRPPTIVGRDCVPRRNSRRSLNGVSGHAMDYDLTYFAGQSIAALIPAICPLPR